MSNLNINFDNVYEPEKDKAKIFEGRPVKIQRRRIHNISILNAPLFTLTMLIQMC